MRLACAFMNSRISCQSPLPRPPTPGHSNVPSSLGRGLRATGSPEQLLFLWFGAFLFSVLLGVGSTLNK